MYCWGSAMMARGYYVCMITKIRLPHLIKPWFCIDLQAINLKKKSPRADLVHRGVSAPDFCNILKLYLRVSDNHKFYSTNTYTCSEYSYIFFCRNCFVFRAQEK
jgi:hypothetical protein